MDGHAPNHILLLHLKNGSEISVSYRDVIMNRPKIETHILLKIVSLLGFKLQKFDYIEEFIDH